MKLPLQINFRNMEGSEAMRNNIEERAGKLDQFCDQIMSCRVMVEAQHRHRQAGNIYHVRIDITVPGKELVVSREPHEHHSHTDAYVAIRDAFNAARRQLENYARQRRREVKSHAATPYGRISQLFIEEGYGRIETPDNRDIYFNRNSLLNGDFEKLTVGSEVSFAEEQGEHGPQASTVRIVGKHHYVEHPE
ncbi:MAG: ribosome-associated translation inhibitor RaiA [Gammaproteobacteria bacterium]|jgi:ribosomal subunit interface protein